MSMTQALLLLVFALAGVVHGMTGIGVTLIATAVLAILYPLPHAMTLAVLPCLVITAVVFWQGGNIRYYLQKYWLLAITSFIGSVLGTKLLLIMPANVLLIAMGAVVIGYVASQLTGKTLHITPNRTNTVIFGLLAGVVGGATNAMSSVIVIYLLSALPANEGSKIEFVKASNLCYLVSKLAQLIVLYPAIVALPITELTLIGGATLVSLLCLFIGFYFRKKISVARFRQLVLLILLVLGVKALIKGLAI